MSKDHLIRLYEEPDLDSNTILYSNHRTNISTTGIIEEDPYPFPLNREREKFEKILTTQRGEKDSPVEILWRRIS